MPVELPSIPSLSHLPEISKWLFCFVKFKVILILDMGNRNYFYSVVVIELRG
jgi:hypothetical protein